MTDPNELERPRRSVRTSATDGHGAALTSATTTYSLDTRAIGASDLPGFLQEWQERVGPGFQMPSYQPASLADFRVRFRAVGLHDVLIHRQESFSPVRTAEGPDDHGVITLFLIHRGQLSLCSPANDDGQTVSAGQFAIRRVRPTSESVVAPRALGSAVTLPESDLAPLLGNRVVRGRADTAEMALLAAHVDVILRHAAELSPIGAQAARDALVELAKAVVRGAADHTDSQLAPALVQAAKKLADRTLTDPDLGPAMLAGKLHVSVRTLQRAFAATGESVTAYIRNRRLDEARRDLTNPAGRMTISEIAARWQFADNGHFSRAFKQRYGQTPSGSRALPLRIRRARPHLLSRSFKPERSPAS